MLTRRLIILGSTGSIGVNALEVVAHLIARRQVHFDVVGLATGSRAALVREQARQFHTPTVAIANDPAERTARDSSLTEYHGADAATELIDAIAQRGDLVIGAMVGSAGIPAIMAAIAKGCDIALANKETLVAAGALVMPMVRKHGVRLLPIDSEHSAIFQCLNLGEADHHSIPRAVDHKAVHRIILTASGGPFRTWSPDRIARASVDEALNHPTWNMGPKVTIDSASLMNKALEIIEAHWLFDLPSSKIDAIIHPQSIVHGMVEYVDGSVVAHLSAPDMKLPIQHALMWPLREVGLAPRLDWSTLSSLEFEKIDEERFPAASLAKQAIDAGGIAGTVLNAANEEAVRAFLDRRIAFGRIVELVRQAVETIPHEPVRTMTDVLNADRAAREVVRERVLELTTRLSTALP